MPTTPFPCPGSYANIAPPSGSSLLFILTSVISGYTLQYYKFNGNLPGYDNRKIRGGAGENIDPDKAAFSMAPPDDEAYERVNMDDTEAAYAGDQYGHANPYSADDYDDPSRYGSLPSRNNGMFDADTEYTSTVGPTTAAASYGGSAAPSSHPYDDPAHFPAANYDRIER